MFSSKHSITFENKSLQSCLFYSVDIFYIKFRSCETFTVINSMTRTLLIETLYKFRNITMFTLVIAFTFILAKLLGIVFFIRSHFFYSLKGFEFLVMLMYIFHKKVIFQSFRIFDNNTLFYS